MKIRPLGSELFPYGQTVMMTYNRSSEFCERAKQLSIRKCFSLSIPVVARTRKYVVNRFGKLRKNSDLLYKIYHR